MTLRGRICTAVAPGTCASRLPCADVRPPTTDCWPISFSRPGTPRFSLEPRAFPTGRPPGPHLGGSGNPLPRRGKLSALRADVAAPERPRPRRFLLLFLSSPAEPRNRPKSARKSPDGAGFRSISKDATQPLTARHRSRSVPTAPGVSAHAVARCSAPCSPASDGSAGGPRPAAAAR